jgi:RNA polymerase sigma factor (sigma-70 family)
MKASVQETKFQEELRCLIANELAMKSLQIYIKTLRLRYNLGDIDSLDVLNEAIYRAIIYFRNNPVEIINLKAWLRTAINLILMNQVRLKRKEENIAKLYIEIEPTTSNDPSEKLECEDTSKQIKLALQTLSDEDQEILNLYVYQDKSYEEIKKYYEPGDIQIGTIRQRVSRAIKRLTKAFHSLNQE